MIANQLKIPDPEKNQTPIQVQRKTKHRSNYPKMPMLPTTAMMAKDQTETGIKLLIGKADIVKPNSWKINFWKVGKTFSSHGQQPWEFFYEQFLTLPGLHTQTFTRHTIYLSNQNQSLIRIRPLNMNIGAFCKLFFLNWKHYLKNNYLVIYLVGAAK